VNSFPATLHVVVSPEKVNPYRGTAAAITLNAVSPPCSSEQPSTVETLQFMRTHLEPGMDAVVEDVKTAYKHVYVNITLPDGSATRVSIRHGDQWYSSDRLQFGLTVGTQALNAVQALAAAISEKVCFQLTGAADEAVWSSTVDDSITIGFPAAVAYSRQLRHIVLDMLGFPISQEKVKMLNAHKPEKFVGIPLLWNKVTGVLTVVRPPLPLLPASVPTRRMAFALAGVLVHCTLSLKEATGTGLADVMRSHAVKYTKDWDSRDCPPRVYELLTMADYDYDSRSILSGQRSYRFSRQSER
jgi:hypothetical protein